MGVITLENCFPGRSQDHRGNGALTEARRRRAPVTGESPVRVFAIMRSCEGHLRHNLTEDSMTEEVSAKCNDWVLEGMVQRQVQLFGRR